MDDKIRDLLRAALEKTEAGGLKWAAFDSGSFRAMIGPGHLHIHRGTTQASHDGDNFYPVDTFSVQVTDAKGRVVAEAEVMEGNDHFWLFDNLFNEARKSALGSDRVISDMLVALGWPGDGSRVSH